MRTAPTPMQLNEHTPQAALERLYAAVTRREMLQSTPLNLRMFLRYAVLFVLFPGMVGGFRIGLGLALVFCVLLAGLMLGGMPEQAALAVRVWLTAGACVLAWVSCGTVRAAIALMRLRRCERPADTPAQGQLLPPELPLRWRRAAGDSYWEATPELSAPGAGIYALLIRIEGIGRGRLLTPDRRGVCVVQSGAQEGGMQVLLLYRLQPGLHRLRWLFVPASGGGTAPRGAATVICRPLP